MDKDFKEWEASFANISAGIIVPLFGSPIKLARYVPRVWA
jgi:hypothetical protein